MSNHKNPEVKIAIANCSGRSNIGQMSLYIAKRLDQTLPYANINCLPAIAPNLKPAQKFREADAIVEKKPGLDFDTDVAERIAQDVIEKVKKLAESLVKQKASENADK